MKRVLLFFFITLTLYAQQVDEINASKLNLDYLQTLQRGIQRDFYINEYLKTNISKEEAFQTLSLIDNMSEELFFNFAKSFKDDETLAVAQCMRMDLEDLLNSHANCIVIGLSLEEASTLPYLDLQLVIQKTSTKYPIFTKKLKVISSSIPFTKLIVQKTELFYDIYLNVSDEFREKYFNYKLPNKTFTKIFSNSKKFDEFLFVSLKNENLNILNKSLLDLDDSNLNANSSFLLALNALKFKDTNKAMKYLQNSLNKAPNNFFKQKIIFWKYQITRDNTYLEELLLNKEINFYAIFANEILNSKKSYFSTIKRVENLDILLKEHGNKRVALLYSISKVLSNFNKNKISKKFDIGFMQLNSKILNTISSSLEEELNLLKQFEIDTSVKYANIYLNNLENSYKDPLLIYLAYSLNNQSLTKIQKVSSFDLSDYKSFLVFEYINKSEELKEFISSFYVYYNLLERKTEDKITLSSIFENLVLQNQKLDEKNLK